MKKLLGEEYESFYSALTTKEAERGFRINRIKTDDETFDSINIFPSNKLDYIDGGYILTKKTDALGNTPHHASGMIYVQDPGAMATAEAVRIQKDMLILDLCAAPGGKSTQVASKLRGTGLIVSNEYVSKRAKILVSNFERMGITNGIVTSLDTREIAKLFDSVFDLVIADAPCSGEGMFRKDVPAIEEWSEENVEICRVRQSEILKNAATTVKDGGYLLYSTCTYSLEENEMMVDAFLEDHPDYRLVEVSDKIKAVTKGGVSFPEAAEKNLEFTRRFYPHISNGEGQFIALFKRNTTNMPTFLYKDSTKPPKKETLEIVERFFRDNLKERPSGRVAMHGDNIVLISHNYPIPPYSVFSSGVLIGEIKGKTLIPSHQFYSAYGCYFIRQENITDDAAAYKYLSGEQIPASFNDAGICAVLYHGVPLGGGKMSGGNINNHYPKGLRFKQADNY